MADAGPFSAVYFVLLVMVGNFVLVNLILAVVLGGLAELVREPIPRSCALALFAHPISCSSSLAFRAKPPTCCCARPSARV